MLEELESVLGRERHVLEGLLFRLLEARGLLAIGEARFLAWAAADLEQATASVREVELRRATVAARVSSDQRATLRDIAAQAPEPLASLLEDHRRALGRLAVEVGAALERTQDLAREGLARVRSVGQPAPHATATGRAGVAVDEQGVPARLGRTLSELDDLDREIVAAGYEAVLAASDRLALPSLIAFLG